MENRKLEPIIAYEREPISDFVGNEKDKILFLQKFPRVAIFSKKGTTFHASGIYQIGNGPTVLVLPWFYKKENFLEADKVVFDSINEISVYKESLLSLSKTGNTNAIDLILRSFLLKLNLELDKIINLNFHNDTYEEVSTIKGKWNINRDLRKGPRPLKFSCTFGELDKDHPILNFTKSFLLELKRRISSKSNKAIVKSALNKLIDVPTKQISSQLIHEARNSVESHKHFNNWKEIVNFTESFLLNNDAYEQNAGVSFKFEMDKFFEELVFQLGRLVHPKGVHTQHREEILGRSFWTSDSQLVSIDNIKNNMSSRPDLYIETQKELFILECKYKPFKIPYINESENSSDLKSFGRDDRNQLLSFLISLTPSPTMNDKKVNTAVLFPCRDVKDFKVVSLVFNNAKFKIDSVSKSISQIRTNVDENNRLEVKFVGLNIESCLKAIRKKDNQFAENILLRIGGQFVSQRPHNEKSRFNKALDRRLGLASFIVDKGRNDKTLGRIKLAKIIYIMDSHLKLDLMGKYERRAAGPYNPKMFRDEKYGIESLAEKQRYFKKIEQANASGEIERVRYVVSSSLEHGKNLAEQLFFDKKEELNRIWNLFSRLDTDRSEIVATLYACWNDLIKKGKNPSDDEIVKDMKFNWHDSKKRFEDSRLKNAIHWMRDNDLIPDGNGPTSLEVIFQQQVPSF